MTRTYTASATDGVTHTEVLGYTDTCWIGCIDHRSSISHTQIKDIYKPACPVHTEALLKHKAPFIKRQYITRHYTPINDNAHFKNSPVDCNADLTREILDQFNLYSFDTVFMYY